MASRDIRWNSSRFGNPNGNWIWDFAFWNPNPSSWILQIGFWITDVQHIPESGIWISVNLGFLSYEFRMSIQIIIQIPDYVIVDIMN